MKTRTARSAYPTTLPLLLLLGLLLPVTGCRNKAVAWNLNVSALTTAPVRFDIVGINITAYRNWMAMSVDDYWSKPNNPVRANANRITFEVVGQEIKLLETNIPEADAAETLTGIGTDRVTLTKENAAWKVWLDRNAQAVVIIGDFPGASPGNPDPRRQIEPIVSGYWDTKGRELDVEIQDKAVYFKTPATSKGEKIKRKMGLY